MITIGSFTKDPNAVLPYTVDWSRWLAGFDPTAVIESCAVEAPAGITIESFSNTDTSVTLIVSGGTVGASYAVTVRVLLDQGPPYVEDRTVVFNIRER